MADTAAGVGEAGHGLHDQGSGGGSGGGVGMFGQQSGAGGTWWRGVFCRIRSWA